MFSQQKKFLRFRHAAIKRFGDRRWTAADGYIEFNPNYTVSVGLCEKSIIGDAGDYAYIVELSNGTKFLTFLHEYGQEPGDEILSDKGEKANGLAHEYSFAVGSRIQALNNVPTWQK